MRMFRIGAYLPELEKNSNPCVIPQIIIHKSLTDAKERIDHVFPFNVLWLKLNM